MDTGLGKFEEVSSEMADLLNEKGNGEIPVFEVGETLEVKGGTYEVKKIKKHELILKPVGRRTRNLHDTVIPE